MFSFLKETLILALRNLRLHKLRSLLTAMGIIFGVAAVIIMVSIGEGAKQSAREQMDKLGAKNIVIRSVRPAENESSGRAQRVLQYGIKRIDLARLRELPGLAAVVPLRDTEQNVSRGDTRAFGANAIGTTPNVFEVVNLKLSRGNLFTGLQYDRSEAVCVIGSTVARQLFPYQDPIGSTLKVGTSASANVTLTIIGVLEPTGLRAGSDGAAVIDRDLDQDVYFPLSLAADRFGDTNVKRQSGSVERKVIELSEVWLQANRIEDVEKIASVAQNILEIGHKRNVDFTVKAPIQILRNAERLNRMFNFIMVGIASFSLVVGGIGIMNIMLATVTERTKEIGIRRALGAKRRHITLQFLIETTTISIGGGLIGISLGMGFAKLLPIMVAYVSEQSYPTNITPWSVIGSFVVSALIGIGFGLYPAMMAARMNPIEALRHE
ncbi:MAG TPA: ABC transporter permease [Tepidisphaeraceae bacterium]|jgi:putative ABC transport system permease protein|nr:ABC transporter permease [Tepidisphaeraceae bacterium]